jgi:uncharacterized membrane protein YbhN (UPF0104 family)
MTDKKANIRKTFNYLIRAVIIIITYGFIYRQVFVERKLQEIISVFEARMEQKNAGLLMAVILLMMLLNWGIESIKWRILIAKIERISYLRSFMAVMTGISVSIFMPNRTGDYLGRVFILEKGNHLEGILITIIGSFAQIVVTLCVGLFCFLSFLNQYIHISFHMQDYLLPAMILLIPSVVFIILLFYFNISLLTDFISRIMPGKWKQGLKYVLVFKKYSSRELLSILLLSLARYIVFSTQFYLLLFFFGVDLPVLQAVILIPVIYLLMSLIPTVALTELGIRGAVAIYVIMLYFAKTGTATVDTEMVILTASSLLWLINLILPAITGTFFVFSLRFFRK